MVAEMAAAAVAIIAAGAELLHAPRIRRISLLAFGPDGQPAAWARFAPLLRVAALSALAWGLTTLLLLTPKVHKAATIADDEYRHLLLVLDVSPSMRLQDAGPEKDKSRRQRAAEIMASFLQRVPVEHYRISVVAVYSGAKPVVVDTTDSEVVRNILNDLPMEYAFRAGKTNLFAGLEEAARIARPWKPRSTTLVMVTDGDTVPATGMPRMPASVADALVIGVGDPVTGKFIDGRQSRQDTSTLRQLAARLGGIYHNGNEKHVATATLKELAQGVSDEEFEQLTRRDYALIACGVGAALLALLPLWLHWFGTRWTPGVIHVTPDRNAQRELTASQVP